jgi:hypothetical protein
MLYPLSYEGLIYAFAQHAGEWWSVGPGLAASLPTACAAPVPRAVERFVSTVSTRSADCTAVVSSSESPYPLRRQAPCFGHGPVGASVERTDHAAAGSARAPLW